MKKKSALQAVAILTWISLMVLAGFVRQAQAVMPTLELTGTVERKIRSAESPPGRYVEPGTPVGRVDRATAIIIDGNRMFILPQTIVKKMDGLIIDFDEVAVPCQVKIVYQQLPNGAKNVLEMHILSESGGATRRWAAPEPQ